MAGVIRLAIVAAPCLLGLIWMADHAAGTIWALPVAACAVWAVFSVDRVYAWKARRRMRSEALRYHVIKDSTGEVIAFFPRHRDAA